MGKTSPRYFIHKEGRRLCEATEYVYEIDMQIYRDGSGNLNNSYK